MHGGGDRWGEWGCTCRNVEAPWAACIHCIAIASDVCVPRRMAESTCRVLSTYALSSISFSSLTCRQATQRSWWTLPTWSPVPLACNHRGGGAPVSVAACPDGRGCPVYNHASRHRLAGCANAAAFRCTVPTTGRATVPAHPHFAPGSAKIGRSREYGSIQSRVQSLRSWNASTRHVMPVYLVERSNGEARAAHDVLAA